MLTRVNSNSNRHTVCGAAMSAGSWAFGRCEYIGGLIVMENIASDAVLVSGAALTSEFMHGQAPALAVARQAVKRKQYSL